jgi:hypothetical protein
MSLLTECQVWPQRALAALRDAALGGRAGMRLQAALGLSLMWTGGNSEATHAALNRSMAIADALGDAMRAPILGGTDEGSTNPPARKYISLKKLSISLRFRDNCVTMASSLPAQIAVVSLDVVYQAATAVESGCVCRAKL